MELRDAQVGRVVVVDGGGGKRERLRDLIGGREKGGEVVEG